MTIYEQAALTIWPVESPLNEYADTDEIILHDDGMLHVDYHDLAPDPLQQRMILILGFATLAILAFGLLVVPNLLRGSGADTAAAETETAAVDADTAVTANLANAAASGIISPIFSPEVQYWAPQIVQWAGAHNLDPNMVATVMQIESCGDPGAVSVAGAQGLFQVMPFHFAAGENMQDPETNAMRGMAYLAERLQQTRGDVGKAFAGYNGGHVAAGTSWDNWAAETQRYYVWSTGIYEEASQGAAQSQTLQEWMAAGGASLCRQAAQRIGLQ